MRDCSAILLFVLVFAITGSTNTQIAFDEELQKQMAKTNLSSAPLAFTENRGQFGEKILFKANVDGIVFYFCTDGVVYHFTHSNETLDRNMIISGSEANFTPLESMPEIDPLFLCVKFVDSNKDTEIIGVKSLDSKNNYFIGNDPNKWRKDLPSYQAIIYKELYPGIDLKYYSDGVFLKYDFIVSPGTDLTQIRILYEGVQSLVVNNLGEMVVETDWGTFIERIPRIYQLDCDGMKTIKGKHILLTENSFGFEVDNGYCPAQALFIDPILDFGRCLGGSSNDWCTDIAIDDSGNTYIVGYTASDDFPTINAYDSTYNGHAMTFVTKLAGSDGSIIYSTYFGGNGATFGFGIDVDNNGSAYITGHTSATDLPIVNAYDSTRNGTYDAFLFKLGAEGNTILYSTYLGGNDTDHGSDVVVVDGNRVVVTGYTESTDFPPPGGFDSTYADSADGYVVLISAGGDSLVTGTYLGGNGMEYFLELDVDNDGSVWVTGTTESSNFPLMNPFDSTLGHVVDAFVSKISPNLDTLYFSSFLGGSDGDWGKKICVDINGDVYTTGFTKSSDFPTVNPYSGYLNGYYDAYVLKLSGSDEVIIFCTFFGGGGADYGYSIAADDNGNVYLAGLTLSSDFPLVNPFDSSFGGVNELFISKFNSDFSQLIYSSYLGGSDYESYTAYECNMAMSGEGIAFLGGYTQSTDFPTTNPHQGSCSGVGQTSDAFAVKISGDSEPIPTLSDWGLLILALLLLAAGTVAVVRRRKATTCF